ncbi:hypothetical protein [Microbulbifer pacificus]|uniref:Yip1 domain-containing protein n=1 Tax=Microbulbifer pacificus TaxID=407164 RepID=A0AAU0MYX9_9GAMM|nr:hypothetical protein [Microbulbifer pacificus]WOX04638.1 hypothetical protein R5R33_12915 [Microbulbifer pacificus]
MSMDEQSPHLTIAGEPSESDVSVEKLDHDITTGSPLAPGNLFALYLRPSRFFSNHSWLYRRYEIILVAWLAGVISIQERIDVSLSRFGMTENPSMMVTGADVSGAWAAYFGFSLTAGMVKGVLLWFLAGWWYHARLELSGAKDVPIEHARAAYQYQNLVQTLPSLVFVIAISFQYSSYVAYWQEGSEVWATFLLLFSYWSCWVSYYASRTFSVSKWKAGFWFLLLPIIFYSYLFGFISIPQFSIGPFRFAG